MVIYSGASDATQPSFPRYLNRRANLTGSGAEPQSGMNQCCKIRLASSPSRAILPLGPTAQGILSAFQLAPSSRCQVCPLSVETSLPLGPTQIHACLC